jgi:hypothetical protein
MRAKLALIDGLSAVQARSAFEAWGRAYRGLSTLGLMGQSLQTLGNRNIGGGSAFSGGSGFAMSQLQLASAETDRYDYHSAAMTDSSNGSSGLWPLRVREDGGAWAQVAGGHGNTRSDGNAAGYTSNSNGLLMGWNGCWMIAGAWAWPITTTIPAWPTTPPATAPRWKAIRSPCTRSTRAVTGASRASSVMAATSTLPSAAS